MDRTVTVLITFYNPGNYILQALDSVYEQTYTSWKIVLVDDGSTDNSVELIQDYLKDSRITLIRHPINQGQSKSLNTGLQVIDTPFFIQLDADDWYYPNTLEVLMKEAEKLPEDVALISGNLKIVFEDRTGKIYRSFIKKGKSFSERYTFMQTNTSAWPRCYRTASVKEIGGWPTDDPFEGRYVEDLRMLYLLIENHRFHWVDKALLYHRRHQLNQTNNIKDIGDTLKWIINHTLIKWGDEYKPTFKQDDDGLIILEKLVKKE